MLLTRHPWLDTYWQERVKNSFVDFVWYRRFTLQISGLLSRASLRFLIFIKYEKNRCVRSLSVVEVLIGSPFGRQPPVASLQAGSGRCRRRPCRLFLPLVGAPSASSPKLSNT